MKKTLFSVIAIALFAVITSCQSNQKETTDGDSTTASQSIPGAAVAADIPKFSSEEVNEGFAKFEPLKQEYIAALKSKDEAKIKAVNDKYIEWIKVAVTWGNKLTQEESKLHTDYYSKLVHEWESITPKTKK